MCYQPGGRTFYRLIQHGLFYNMVLRCVLPFFFFLWALVQIQLRTEVLCTPSLTRPGFELMTSRSWQYILCHRDTCSDHSAISDIFISVCMCVICVYLGIYLKYTKIQNLIYQTCPVDWREISMKQSVGKCKQINF